MKQGLKPDPNLRSKTKLVARVGQLRILTRPGQDPVTVVVVVAKIVVVVVVTVVVVAVVIVVGVDVDVAVAVDVDTVDDIDQTQWPKAVSVVLIVLIREHAAVDNPTHTT